MFFSLCVSLKSAEFISKFITNLSMHIEITIMCLVYVFATLYIYRQKSPIKRLWLHAINVSWPSGKVIAMYRVSQTKLTVG